MTSKLYIVLGEKRVSPTILCSVTGADQSIYEKFTMIFNNKSDALDFLNHPMIKSDDIYEIDGISIYK